MYLTYRTTVQNIFLWAEAVLSRIKEKRNRQNLRVIISESLGHSLDELFFGCKSALLSNTFAAITRVINFV